VEQQQKDGAALAARLNQKAINKARYQRRFAGHQPAPKSTRYPAGLRLTPAQRAACVIRGVPEYLQQVVRMRYGAPGTWGHGRYESATRKGPGRRRLPLVKQVRAAGSKLARRFFEKLS
jgi:hypothetical protein